MLIYNTSRLKQRKFKVAYIDNTLWMINYAGYYKRRNLITSDPFLIMHYPMQYFLKSDQVANCYLIHDFVFLQSVDSS